MSKKAPFWIGIDLGQSSDFSTATISHRREVAGVGHYDVVHLQRYELGMPYPEIVRDVIEMVQRPELADGWKLIVDRTGVGRPVFDMFAEARLSPVGVTITAGSEAHRDPDDRNHWLVPKLALISNAKVLLQSGRLHFAKGLKHTADLVSEMMSFEMRYTTAANVVFESWREGAHDDLLLGLAVALWTAEYGKQWGGGVWFPGDVGGASTHRPGVRDALPAPPKTGAEINEEAERKQVANLSRDRKVRIRMGRVGGLEIHEIARRWSLSTRQVQWVLEADD
ncbi:MAG: hypothetical protein IH953_02765 [Chloroflexi bacterium]|nr:hypothetical protein [Chloroflexota bacterium]